MRNIASLKDTPFQKGQIALVVVLAVLSLSACECSLSQTEVERSVLNMHRAPDIRSWRNPDESEIAIAQAEARRRFNQFRIAYDTWKPASQSKESLKKEECFEVKIPVSMLLITEHIWMNVTALNKDTVTGKLDASPEILRMYGKDSVFTVPIAKVEDWAYGNFESSIGSFTLFPLRKCKLQELNNISLRNGQPTVASLAACNTAWAQQWNRFGNLNLSDWKKLWAQEGQKTKADQQMNKQDQGRSYLQEEWAENSQSLVKDVEQSLRKNHATAPSEQDVVAACGLPLDTVRIIDKLNQHFDEIMQALAKESESSKVKQKSSS
jgi:uncharacterized protein YegJ (DUF2314 family)